MRNLKKMSEYEFNNIVSFYNNITIDITTDIINKINKTSFKFDTETEFQIRKIIQLNGEEIFYSTLQKLNNIEPKVKKELESLFKTVALEEINEYKELYEYRDKDLRLSNSQLQILQEGILKTKKGLNNFNKILAYNCEQKINELTTKAYLETVTGAFTYTEATRRAYLELKKDGINIQSKNGRKEQVDNIVRLDVFSKLRETTNLMNEDIEKELNCNGKEVTAHIGARPTHAEFQGKQYALNKEDGFKYNLPLWSSVENLWNEYYCKHTFFGIILGISTPNYNNKELKYFENAKVEINNEKVPYYEATQIQRGIERNIRKLKKEIELDKNLKNDTTEQNKILKEKLFKYKEFCKNVGVTEYRERLKI